VALPGGLLARPLLRDDAPWLASEDPSVSVGAAIERALAEPRRSYLRGVEAGAVG